MELGSGTRKVLLGLPISILLLAILVLAIFSGRDRRPDQNRADSPAPGLVTPAGESAPSTAAPAPSGTEAGQGPSAAAPEGAPLLSGKVLDSRNQPISGARIAVRFPEDVFGGFEAVARARALGSFSKKMEVLGKAVSDEAGHYQVVFETPPEPGEYRVAARAPGYRSFEEAWSFSGSPSILDIHLDHGGETIEGIVVERGGAPIGKARVEAERDDGGRDVPWARAGEVVDRETTGPDGRFRLDVSPGAFRISAHAKGHAHRSLRGVEAGSREVRIELGPSRDLAGRVIDPEGNPVPGASLALYAENERSAEMPARLVRLLKDAAASGETGADGTFHLEDLSVESYLLEIRKSGFEVAQHVGKIGEGQDPAIEIRLKPGGILEGTVTDESGAPVPGALVCLQDDAVRKREHEARRLRESERELGAPPREKAGGKGKPRAAAAARSGLQPVPISHADFVTETDAAGNFRADTLRLSFYTLSVQSERHAPHVQEGLEVLARSRVAVVLSAGITLRGRVLERPGGGPVARATLWIETGENDRRTVQSDAEGRYEVNGLLPGAIREVRIRAPGHTIFRQAGPEVLSEPREQVHDFALDLAAVLSGRVISAGGGPVANALVRATGADEEPPADPGADRGGLEAMRLLRQTERSCRTGPDGSFRLSDVNAGRSVQVIITHPDYQELRSEPFAVKPGSQVEGLLYRLASGGKLQVLALRPDHTPAAGARVQVHHQREAPDPGHNGPGDGADLRGEKASLATGAEGKAVLTGLRGGLYTVVVTASGYRTFHQEDVAVTEDGVAELSAELVPESVLAGTVRDTAGEPVEGAVLRVIDGAGRAAGQKAPARERTLARSMSQLDGSFRLTGLGDGPYRVEVSAGGFADRALDGVPVDRPLEVRLQRLGSIEGTVQVGETGEVVDRFNVTLRRKGRKEEAPADWKGTVRWGPSGSGSRQLDFESAGGRFILPDVEPGQYVIRVLAPDLSPREVPVRVGEGAVARASFLLYEGIVVSGVVESIARSEPVPGAQVLVYPLPASPAPAEKKKAAAEPASPRPLGRPVADAVPTDENGSFGIRDIPAGKYVLVVSHPDFVVAQEPFEIKAEGLTREMRIGLEPGETLSGTVEDAGSTHPAGAVVIVRDAGGLARRSTTDVAGRYSIHGLKLGPCTFSVQLPGDGQAAFQDRVEIKKGDNRFDPHLRT